MKKAIKTIAAAILLLNTTSIVNHKMAATQAMEAQEGTANKLNRQMLNLFDNMDTILTGLENDTVDNKTKLLSLAGQHLNDKINKSIEENNTNILQKMKELINTAVEDQKTNLESQIDTLRKEQIGEEQVKLLTELTQSTGNKADHQIKSLLDQLYVQQQITLGAGSVMGSLAMGVRELSAKVNGILAALDPQTKEAALSKSTLEAIKNSLTAFKDLKEVVIKSNKDQTESENKLKQINTQITNLTNQLKPIGASNETSKFQNTGLKLTEDNLGDDLDIQINDENAPTTHNNNQ